MRTIFRLFLCPLLTLVTSMATAQSNLSTVEPSPVGLAVVGYRTVQEALEALKQKPNVRIEVTKPDAWIIAHEPADIQWSFAPAGHYAYPAVVRRVLKVDGSGDLRIEMSALCQAAKSSCDQLLKEFEELNERIHQSVKARVQK